MADSLSESAWAALGAQEGAQIHVGHPDPLESVSALRAKVYGQRLGDAAWREIVADIVNGHYSNLHLAALVTACAGDRMDADETLSLTRAMVESGERLTWQSPVVVDKHCVGGLPGNRTTLIVVPIVAAAGLIIPKTSSRAITSPAGTADTMEVMAPVGLDVKQMRRVVESEGGCIVWGGNVRLSPADDLLIRVERPLDFDSEGHLVASVLSKKIAAGSTHVMIDMRGTHGQGAFHRSGAFAAAQVRDSRHPARHEDGCAVQRWFAAGGAWHRSGAGSARCAGGASPRS
jgi:thymidine phosphorylase